MATVTNNAVAKAGNGLGSKTTIIVTDAAVADDAALAVIVNEIGYEGHTIAGIAGTANNAGVMHFAIQGGGVPAITGCSVVATFEDNV
jgi:hypothetical protein